MYPQHSLENIGHVLFVDKLKYPVDYFWLSFKFVHSQPCMADKRAIGATKKPKPASTESTTRNAATMTPDHAQPWSWTTASPSPAQLADAVTDQIPAHARDPGVRRRPACSRPFHAHTLAPWASPAQAGSLPCRCLTTAGGNVSVATTPRLSPGRISTCQPYSSHRRLTMDKPMPPPCEWPAWVPR